MAKDRWVGRVFISRKVGWVEGWVEGWTPVILVKLRETPESIESRDISQSVKCGLTNAEGCLDFAFV